MVDLYRVKSVRQLTALFFVIYFIVRIYRLWDIPRFQLSGLLQSDIGEWWALSGLLVSAGCLFRPRSLILPVVSVILVTVEIVLFHYALELIVLNSAMIFMIPFAKYYYGYMDFSKLLNALRLLFIIAVPVMALNYSAHLFGSEDIAGYAYPGLISLSVISLLFSAGRFPARVILYMNSLAWVFLAVMDQNPLMMLLSLFLLPTQYFLFSALKEPFRFVDCLRDPVRMKAVLLVWLLFLVGVYYASLTAHKSPLKNTSVTTVGERILGRG